MTLPVLCCLQSHVASVLGVEASQEKVGLSRGKGGGRLPLCPRAGAGRLWLQRRAETHPHRVGGPIRPDCRGDGRGREAASSDQNQFVSSTLPPHRFGGVEMTAEETVCGGEDERRFVRNYILHQCE